MIKRKIYQLWDNAYSFYMCMRLFPFNVAIKTPILFSHDVKLHNYKKGCIILPNEISRHMVKIGVSGILLARKEQTMIRFVDGATIEFGQQVQLGRGFKCMFEDSGKLVFGNNIYVNCNVSIQCAEKIVFGDNILVGWDTSIRDTDGHAIVENGIKKEMINPVTIGDNVWIASDATILKGSYITDGSVVACKALVCGLKTKESNVLVAGIPAKVIKKDISWIE